MNTIFSSPSSRRCDVAVLLVVFRVSEVPVCSSVVLNHEVIFELSLSSDAVGIGVL